MFNLKKYWPAVLFYFLVGSLVLLQIADAAPAPASSTKKTSSTTSTKSSTSLPVHVFLTLEFDFAFIDDVLGLSDVDDLLNPAYRFKLEYYKLKHCTQPGGGMNNTTSPNNTTISGGGGNSTNSTEAFEPVKACPIKNPKNNSTKSSNTTANTARAARFIDIHSRTNQGPGPNEEVIGFCEQSDGVSTQLEQGQFTGAAADQNLGNAVYWDENPYVVTMRAHSMGGRKVCVLIADKDVWAKVQGLWFTDQVVEGKQVAMAAPAPILRNSFENNRKWYAGKFGITGQFVRYALRKGMPSQVAIPPELLGNGFRVVCFTAFDNNVGFKLPEDISYKAKAQQGEWNIQNPPC
ncbi:hypothetical protein D9758_017740 [Tetrapyrgos nigripes]|uniref:Uncharacterized protein n=1 Tax=Tetrapyrgos nigripes TaxID=182062 RepID=A0A8H5BKU7_9AGAR|nr:hypothetical protein D9758_017740 [Tetrapyrgos nigripes]